MEGEKEKKGKKKKAKPHCTSFPLNFFEKEEGEERAMVEKGGEGEGGEKCSRQRRLRRRKFIILYAI